MAFSNPIWLYALLSLIPLIILYLRKPKPRDKIIPSLMFLIKDKKTENQFSFFKKLIRNLLFIIQLLVLGLLALTLAEPFIQSPIGISPKHTVLIIDASASSQTKYDLATRFDKELSDARGAVSSKNSIIIASEQPIVVLNGGTKREALDILRALQPTDMKTNLEAALYEADALLKEEQAHIIVLSDFITTDEKDQILKATRILTSKGNSIEFIDVSNDAHNIGFIDLELNKYDFRAFIKNFNDKKTVTIRHVQGNKVFNEQSVTIDTNSVEILTFTTQPGVSRLEIVENDDFSVDNKVYISAPLQDKIKVLLITGIKNEQLGTDYLINALTASKEISLSISRPPRTFVTLDNQEISKLNPDVIITHKINKDELLPHEFDTIARMIESGKSIIITAQDQLGQIDLAGLLPVIIERLGEDSPICVDIINEFTKRFKENRCFTDVDRYLITNPKNNSIVIATTEDGSPVMVLKDRDKGKIFYYGIFDDYSDFKLDKDYPIFWNALINFLVASEDINDYNKRMGDEGFLNYTKAGVYELGEKMIAFNLLSEAESNVNKKPEIIEQNKDFYIKPEPEKQPLHIEIPLLIFVTLLVMFEILYIKIQGDL